MALYETNKVKSKKAKLKKGFSLSHFAV